MFLLICILRSWSEPPLHKMVKTSFSESDVFMLKTHRCSIILQYTLYVINCVPLPVRGLSLLILGPRGLDSKQEVGLRQALHSLCLLDLLQNRSNNIVKMTELLLKGLNGCGHFKAILVSLKRRAPNRYMYWKILCNHWGYFSWIA